MDLTHGFLIREIKTNKEAAGRGIQLLVPLLQWRLWVKTLIFQNLHLHRELHIKCYIADTDCRYEEGGKKACSFLP